MTRRKCLIFSFADIEVRERELSIVRNGESLAVEPKAFRVLLVLLKNPHRAITKDELLDAVWNETSVSENSLTRSIALLRRLLADDPFDPRYIATVPTIGYRFVCDVRVEEDGLIGAADEQQYRPMVKAEILSKSEEKQPTDRRRRSTAFLIAGLGVLAVGIPAAVSLLQSGTAKQDASERRGTELRVTSNAPEAPVEHAVVSPDGKYLAYSDPTGLYLRVIASGETRRWGVPKDFIAIATGWFPDGTHLLAMRMEGMPPIPSLWKLSLLGGQPRKLMDNVGAGTVSPDGKRIAFTTSLPCWGRELWVMGADGSNPHKIAESGSPTSSICSPAWSPDSRRITYLERHGVDSSIPGSQLSTVWTRNADGGAPQVIVKDSWLGTGLSWASDGRILFASRTNPESERDDEGVRSIFVDKRTGKAAGTPQFVTDGAGIVGGISVTSDGKRLVLSRTSTKVQAFIADFDDRTRKWHTLRRLTLDANDNIAADWLADNRTVLFVSNRHGSWTLFKQSMDEATAEVLVEGPSLFLPRLSADGSQVLYQSRSDPTNRSIPVSLMRFPLAGGSPQLVLKAVGLGGHQCARLPSTKCLFNKELGDKFVFVSFDAVRGAGRELLRSVKGNWSLSPDGRKLVIFPGDRSLRFFSLEKEDARESNKVLLNDWWVPSGDWTADGKGVLIPSVTPAGIPVILEVNRAGKVSVVLEGTRNIRFWWMLSAPDGHHGVLAAEVPGDNNAWMVDGF
jgi:DNA-binding winged helix-turn-helix (wHTH) protein/Tol biopolymer transport system component